MKVTRQQAIQNRERVVATAARLFRERGFDGVGISDLMKEVGLTHGGFYAQFPSKEHLMAEAAKIAADDREATLRKQLESQSAGSVKAFIEKYLSKGHRDNPGDGCYMATLGVDASRQGPVVRAAFTQAVERAIDMLAKAESGTTGEDRRRGAIADYAGMIGAMVLARAVADDALSEEILSSVKGDLIARHDQATKPPQPKRHKRSRSGS
jgi:TetR/AcrR family transcriptional regulator, transcriptional repressor for nem operon